MKLTTCTYTCILSLLLGLILYFQFCILFFDCAAFTTEIPVQIEKKKNPQDGCKGKKRRKTQWGAGSVPSVSIIWIYLNWSFAYISRKMAPSFMSISAIRNSGTETQCCRKKYILLFIIYAMCSHGPFFMDLALCVNKNKVWILFDLTWIEMRDSW